MKTKYFQKPVFLFATLLIVVAIVSCGDSSGGSSGVVYRGHYANGFEMDSFEPCGTGEQWWVLSIPQLFSLYTSLVANPYEKVYAEFRGTPGPLGIFGHLGAYVREFTVFEVKVLRKAATGDCD